MLTVPTSSQPQSRVSSSLYLPMSVVPSLSTLTRWRSILACTMTRSMNGLNVIRKGKGTPTRVSFLFATKWTGSLIHIQELGPKMMAANFAHTWQSGGLPGMCAPDNNSCEWNQN